MVNPQLTEFVWKSEIVLEVCLIFRLVTSSSRPRALIRFLLCMALSDSLGTLIGTSSPAYYVNYVVSRCVMAILACFVTLEVFDPIYQRYPGVRILRLSPVVTLTTHIWSVTCHNPSSPKL